MSYPKASTQIVISHKGVATILEQFYTDLYQVPKGFTVAASRTESGNWEIAIVPNATYVPEPLRPFEQG